MVGDAKRSLRRNAEIRPLSPAFVSIRRSGQVWEDDPQWSKGDRWRSMESLLAKGLRRMPKEPVYKRRGSCGVSLRMSATRLCIPSDQNSFILRRFHQGEQPPFA